MVVYSGVVGVSVEQVAIVHKEHNVSAIQQDASEVSLRGRGPRNGHYEDGGRRSEGGEPEKRLGRWKQCVYVCVCVHV